MGFPNIDPNVAREQKQLGIMRGLKQAKNTSSISTKKVLLIIIPVFAVALLFILFFSGVFDKGYTVRWNNGIYQISSELSEDLIHELPEGYTCVGDLVFAENPKKAVEDLSSNWTTEAELYANPENDRFVYITAYRGYLKARKK